MKTKITKKLLSVFLAALMVITSLPLAAVAAFAADDAAAEVESAMSEFEDLLASAGAFTNVTPAYEAYVECQKALDAYVYGGETDALSGKADALVSAMSEIGTFTGYTGTAVPTFPTSEESAMAEYDGEGFGNVLYAPEATAVTTSSEPVGGVTHSVYYSESAVLLYDGVNDVILPVMVSAYADSAAGSDSYNKERYIWGCYPADSSYNDAADWGFDEQWNSGNGGDANWNWNWWSGKYNGVDSHAGYNKSTALDNPSTSMKSGMLPKGTRSGNIFGYTYEDGDPLYMSNALKLKTVPDDYSQSYNLYWFVATGGTSNNDQSLTRVSTLKAIRVLNYKTLTDAISENGDKMKSIDLAEYAEGGLTDYIAAMDAATSFDPNSYFVSGDGFDDCVSDMKTVIKNMNNASTAVTDSASYGNLRAAMDAKRTAYDDGTNNGYTEESWAEFIAAWEAAAAVMAAVNDDGYIDEDAAQAAADALNAVVLVTNVEKVDTSALETLIDAFAGYVNIFTTDTYVAAAQLIEEAETAVWTSSDLYKDPASALDLSDENQAIVDSYAAAVEAAIRALRINSAAVVLTEYGRYSLDIAVALEEEISDPADYSNYAAFRTALNAAADYIASLADMEMTDYDALYAEYVAQIEAVVGAYQALTYSFTKLPDGTLANAGKTSSITTLENHKNSSKYNWYFDFDYPTQAIILKTNHEAATVTYGTANVCFQINIDNNISKENNALDSITINGTADENTEINSNWASSKPDALSDSEKETYAGCLASDGFSLTNFRVVGTKNNVKSYYGTTADGTQVTDFESPTDEYTKILGTTEGSAKNPALGTIALQPIEKGNASITLAADINVDIPATEKTELSSSTTLTSTSYIYQGYFGATYVWNTQPDVAYAGYAYATTLANDEPIFSSVTVVDISCLVDLVDMCNGILGDSAMYTDSTWSAFMTKLEAAQADLDYTTLSQKVILQRCQSRYDNLWAAYEALEIKQLPITFNYKDESGADVSTVVNVEYGKTLEDYADEINAIRPAESYNSADGLYKYTYEHEWTPEVDLEAAVTKSAEYTAVYSSELNMADFTAYNNASALLLGMLTDETYSLADMEALREAVDAMTYFTMPDDERAQLLGDAQAAIDAETERINALAAALTPAEITVDAAVAAAELAKASKDRDVYDVNYIDFSYTETVNIGGKDVVALTYGTQEELDAAISDFLNNITICVYTIYVNGTAVGTAEYGTAVIVNSDGEFYADVADIDSPDYNGSTAMAWSYSYSAPSRDGVATESKYMLTAQAVGFVVKGDTYLTAVNAQSDDEGYVVKFATSDGKIFDVQYTTDGTVTIPTAPSYAFYNFTGYEGGYTAGDVITVTEDTTIIADYAADTSNTYTINFYSSMNCWETVGDVGTIISGNYSYNDLVEFSAPDAYCWVTAYSAENTGYINEYTLLAYGESYSFYACKAYEDDDEAEVYEGIVAVTKDEYDTLISKNTTNDKGNRILYDGSGNTITVVQVDYVDVYPDPVATVSVLDNVIPVYDSDGNFTKFSMIGTFTLPEGYTIVECGILFSSNQLADLTVEGVGTNGVARMKASAYTCGNQFVINVKAPSSGEAVSFKYAGYAIVTDADGNLTTLYSKSVLASTEGF